MNVTDDLEKAIAIAKSVHRDDLYGDEPYIHHCIRVMLNFQDELRQIVAVLHDAYEDHPYTISLEYIETVFGSVVRDAIEAISKRKGEQYFDYIERCSKNHIACAVKLADLGENYWRSDPNSDRGKRYHKAIGRLMAYRDARRKDAVLWWAR